MARYEFKLPDIGEGIAEAEIVAWHVKVGDEVAEDQQLADMMTDKATVEMESPVAGKVLEVAGEVGDMIPIGSVLVVIETEGEARRAERRRGADRRRPGEERRRRSRRWCRPPTSTPRRTTAGERRRERGAGRAGPAEGRRGALRAAGGEPATIAPGDSRPQPAARAAGKRRRRSSPRRRCAPRARDLGIDLAPGEDMPATASATPISTPICSTVAAASRAAPAPQRQDESVKVVGLRRKIAENMQEAKRRIPHFTLVEEYDVTALEQTRAMMNADRGGNPKLTMLPVPDHRDGADARRLSADQRHL